jgi:hypothetical protein
MQFQVPYTLHRVYLNGQVTVEADSAGDAARKVARDLTIQELCDHCPEARWDVDVHEDSITPA